MLQNVFKEVNYWPGSVVKNGRNSDIFFVKAFHFNSDNFFIPKCTLILSKACEAYPNF